MDDFNQRQPLAEIWKSFLGVTIKQDNLGKPEIERIIGEMFSIGEFYYYVLNLTNSSLSNFHENILHLHGLNGYPEHLEEIISLIHPEDIPFVLKAEQTVVEKIIEIGFENQLYLKPSYCFRMKTKNGNYELFHHQAVHTLADENNMLLQSINIHTNINHITKENSRIVLISGIGPRNDFHQIKIENYSLPIDVSQKNLTKRESEILSRIVKGYSGKEISEDLIISEHTVKTHRKNILKKTNSRNSKELIKNAFEWGLV